MFRILQKRLRDVAVCLVFLTIASGANATDYNIGLVPTAPAVFSHTPVLPVGSFVDRYFFQVNAASTVSGTAVSIGGINFGNLPAFHISNLTLSLVDSFNNVIISQAAIGATPTATIAQPLASGVYHANVSGTADGAFGGIYTFAVQAIPEPSAAVMMLMGLVILGFVSFVARRKI